MELTRRESIHFVIGNKISEFSFLMIQVK